MNFKTSLKSKLILGNLRIISFKHLILKMKATGKNAFEALQCLNLYGVFAYFNLCWFKELLTHSTHFNLKFKLVKIKHFVLIKLHINH